MQATHILETCLYVNDLVAADRFYQGVLGLELHSRQEGRHLFFRCGWRMLLLFNPEQSHQGPSMGIPAHGAIGAGHIAFGIREAEIPAWREHLERSGIAIERTIDWPAGGQSLYFRDPAGNSLELATPRIWNIPEATLTESP